MVGLDAYASTKRSLVGVDWANLASGVLKGAGGLASGFGGGGDATAAKIEEQKRQLEEQKKVAAEAAATATRWKWIAGGAAVAAVLAYLSLTKLRATHGVK